jgi:hypothetical protein
MPHHLQGHNIGALLSSRTLMTAEGVEIENACKVTAYVWRYFDEFFRRTHQLKPGGNDCLSVYLDTPKLDLLLKLHRTLRDRPGGQSKCGEQYPCQIGVKYIHSELQRVADQITKSFYPEGNGDLRSRIRAEIERPHISTRDVHNYTFFDLPPDIQTQITLPDARNLVFVPQFATYAKRNMYRVFCDPHKQVNFILTNINTPEQAARYTPDYICIEVALDKCVYRAPRQGTKIAALIKKSRSELSGFGRPRADKWLLEHELKTHLCGENVTDGMAMSTYVRFMMLLYNLAEPFKNKRTPEPIRSAGSKAARGYKSKLDCRPDKPWRLAP